MPSRHEPSRGTHGSPGLLVALALSLLMTLGIGLVPSPAHAQTTCPLNTLECMQTVRNTRLPQDLNECSEPNHHGSASYDLISGALDASMNTLDAGGYATAYAYDEYLVLGLPSGTPVSLTVELASTGSIVPLLCGANGTLSAGLQVGAQTRSTHASYACNVTCTCFGTATLDSVLTIAVPATAAVPFIIGYNIAFSGSFASGDVHARVQFKGLPPGAFIRSCQGYRQDGPVPVERVSWGTLKQHYR